MEPQAKEGIRSATATVEPRRRPGQVVTPSPVVRPSPTRLSTAGPAQPSRLRFVLVSVDAAALFASWALVTAGGPTVSVTTRLLVTGAITLVGLGLLRAHQLYLARICRIRAVEVSRLLRVAILTGVAVYLVSGRVATGLDGGSAAAGAVLSFLALAAARSAYTSWLTRMRSHGLASRPVVIVGANEEGADLAKLLKDHAELGYVVAATVGRAHDVAPALKRHRADSVIIAVSALSKTDLNALTRRLLNDGVHVHLSCGVAGIDHRRLRPTPMAHEPIFYLERTTVTRAHLFASRALDIAGSMVGLVATAPILLAAAIAIRLSDRGPVFFRQERIGKDGVPFVMHKLRTMVPDAEQQLGQVAADNLRDGPLYKARNDPRVTRVGRLLRATSIDELPQLLNVLAGSMSLVGPRPALAHEVERFDEELLTRLKVKPGITGLWQVEGRHHASFSSYRRLDLYYLENWSLELDLVILLSTAKALLGQALRDLRGQWRSTLAPIEPTELDVVAKPVPAR